METSETSEWTDEDLQSLFSRIKSQISPKDLRLAYYAGLKRIDWKKVAFTPYSPNACAVKWSSVIAQMRKFRNLKELVEEAESGLADEDVAEDVDEQQMLLEESESHAELSDQCHEASGFECELRMLSGLTYTAVSAEEKKTNPSDSEDEDIDDSCSISVTSDYEEEEDEEEKNEDEEDGFGNVGFDLL